MYTAWGVALLSMFISLIMSDYLKYPPCTLCWYQRIFMYALVFVIPTGLLIRDKKVQYYVRVLSFVGILIAFYHNLIYYNIIEEGLKLCTAELSCKTKQFEMFGFISIPLMSLGAFIFIFTLTFTNKIRSKGEQDENLSGT